MKKLITPVLLSAMMVTGATAAHAEAGDWFVGLEAGKARNSMEAKGVFENGNGDIVTRSESSSKIKSTSYGIRVGKYINDNVRVYGTYSENKNYKLDGNKASGVKDKSLMASADYVFMKDSSFRPFVGASVGASRLKVSGAGNKTSAAFGAQAGVLFQAGPVDAELGVKYQVKGNEIKETVNNVDLRLKNKNTKMAYLSVSYRF